jgi:hypothetical protein
VLISSDGGVLNPLPSSLTSLVRGGSLMLVGGKPAFRPTELWMGERGKLDELIEMPTDMGN